MPSFCVVSNCEYKYTHSENISFHRFPQHSKEVLQKWIDFTDRGSDWKPSKWSAICSRHFLPSDFRNLATRKCLKRNAIPSVTIKQFNFDFLDFQRNKNYELNSTQNELATNCRLCGEACKSIVAFSTNFEVFGMIQKCFPTLDIQQDDELSKNLCADCLQKLQNFSNFFDKVLQTQEKFTSRQNQNSVTKTERHLNIKQEPIVKQEISEGINSKLLNYELENGIEEDYYVENKSHITEFPPISPQEIINNCEIMEIISLDDAFINIPDDDVVEDNHDSPELKINSILELPIFHTENEHNYAQIIDSSFINTLNYKTEKFDENDHVKKSNSEQPQSTENKTSARDIIVINESIVKPAPIYSLYECKKCEMKFLSEKCLEKHTKIEHIVNDRHLHICAICNSSFPSIYKLLQHKNRMHSIKTKKFLKRSSVYPCFNCERKFVSKLALNNHREHICEYRNNSKRVYKEKSKITKIKSVSVSEEIKEPKVQPNHYGLFPCLICGRSYSRRNNLYKHERRHRPVDQWNLKCGDCERLFDRIYDLRQHIKNNECIGDGKQLEQIIYICTTCNKEFKTIQRLETHMAIHSDKRPYVCESCGKSFPCFNNLHQHRITHSDIRRYKCDLCEKVFKRKGGLNQHKRSFHLKLKPHECPVCKHRYALKNDMMRCRHSYLRC